MEKKLRFYINVPCRKILFDRFNNFVKDYNDQEMTDISRAAMAREALIEYMNNHKN